ISCSTLKSLASEASQWRSSATRTVRSSISISHLRFRLSFRSTVTGFADEGDRIVHRSRRAEEMADRGRAYDRSAGDRGMQFGVLCEGRGECSQRRTLYDLEPGMARWEHGFVGH